MRNAFEFGLRLLASSSIFLASSAFAAETPAAEKSPCRSGSSECKVALGEPLAHCPEADKVLEVLHKLGTAINNGDWKTYESLLDDNCTTFDENSKKLIAGKEKVISDMRSKAEKYASEGHPFIAVTIDRPYATVMGDTAVVSFLAIREYGGKHPFKEECQATNIFVKHGDSWKKAHFRGAWKRV